MPTGGRPMHTCQYCGRAIRFDRTVKRWVAGSNKVWKCGSIRIHEPDPRFETGIRIGDCDHPVEGTIFDSRP